MLDVLDAVLPVFVLVGAGYAAVKAKLFADASVDGILRFCTGFAIPCLLFLAIYRLDLGASFDPLFLLSFYAGATVSFALAVLIARKVLKRRPGESIAIGFAALFSNSVLLGLPITERAYGAGALGPNYALIALHAPYCYLLGVTCMEISRADGRNAFSTARATVIAMFRNSLTLALAVGFVFNIFALGLPAPLMAGVEMMARASLPVALFGLGGVLTRYALTSGLREAAVIASLSLLVHPAITFALGAQVFDLEAGFVRSSVVNSSMPPGINAYLFAAMYQRAVGVAASTVLLATAASVFTVSLWLLALRTAGY